MPGTGQKDCGVVVFKPILVFSLAQAKQNIRFTIWSMKPQCNATLFLKIVIWVLTKAVLAKRELRRL